MSFSDLGQQSEMKIKRQDESKQNKIEEISKKYFYFKINLYF